MKHIVFAFMLATAAARAQIVIPANNLGTDGALNLSNQTRTIALGAARTGNWEEAGDGNGIFDPEKWAVVFKYSSVNISGASTLTFANHPSGAPVVWLVDGDVTISGVVNLDGKPGGTATLFAEPGPGGFRGGAGIGNGGSSTSGFGPGGGRRGHGAGAGSYGTRGSNSGTQVPAGDVYGTDDILPLIGGSGGGADGSLGGGAGGGAILIVASGTISLGFNSAGIYARGGSAQPSAAGPGGGSGGAIRLVCDRFTTEVTSKLEARGGGYSGGQGSVWFGGMGRIRIETNLNEGTIATTPPASIATVGTTARIWPDPEEMSIAAVMLGNSPLPADPRALFTFGNTDAEARSADPAVLTIQASHVPLDALVEVRLVPVTQNANDVRVAATFFSGSEASSVWLATLPVTDGVSAFQVTVTLP